jgi:dTDP-glucose pyrophosphorylase
MHDMRIAKPRDVEHLFVDLDASILVALDVIDKGGFKTALVVDKGFQFRGLIADPDIRRALLKGVSLEQPVHMVMNTTPITLRQGISQADAKRALFHHKRDLLPVLSSDNRVVDVAILAESIGRTSFDNAVVLMAGGLGTRLLPLTRDVPKPMIEVGSKPMLETLVENFVAAGFSNIYLSVNYMQQAIRDHFGDGKKWGAKITYLQEDQALGTAGGLSLIRENVTQPFITMNCDVLTNVDFESLLLHHDNAKSMATMCVSQHEVTVPYGVVEHDNFELKRIVEKPAWNYFVNAGIYVFSPEVLDFLEEDKAIDMPELLDRVQSKSGKTSLFPLREYWLDVGNHNSLEQARHDFKQHFGEK